MSVNNNESGTNIWSDPEAVLSCASLIGELIMNANNINEPDTSMNMSCCASCGTSEDDEIQLRTCTACKSVRYCGVKCQRDHRPKHKKACKKRAAELRDELLFKQPESSHLGDCPICLLPLPIKEEQITMVGCCSINICDGCMYANGVREREKGLEHKCPFCRDPLLLSRDTIGSVPGATSMKRVEANDPMALCCMADARYEEGNYVDAFEYLTKAAGLGDAESHYKLSKLYLNGEGVEKDEKKQIHHLEEAAIAGHPYARLCLACYEDDIERFDRADKHLVIAANLGLDESIQSLKDLHGKGFFSKEQLAAALRGHEAAVDAMKSPQREAAEASARRMENNGIAKDTALAAAVSVGRRLNEELTQDAIIAAVQSARRRENVSSVH